MPDFGIMRGFNEKLFGDKLYAGQLPTQLGLIGSQEVFDTDADAQAFFDRVTAAGGTLSTTEKTAVDTLVKQMKLDGTWTPMKAIYPMVGASAAACAQNLKSSSFTGTFTSGWTFASTGITTNGNAYMNTALIPSASLLLNDVHIGGYIRSVSSVAPLLSAEDVSSFDNALYIWPTTTSYGGSVRINDNTSTTNSTLQNPQGLHLATRTASNEKKYRINKVEKFNVTAVSTNLNTQSIRVASGYNSGFSFVGEIAYITIGDGLTNAQCDLYVDAVQAFQTTLSRQV